MTLLDAGTLPYAAQLLIFLRVTYLLLSLSHSAHNTLIEVAILFGVKFLVLNHFAHNTLIEMAILFGVKFLVVCTRSTCMCVQGG